MKDFGCINASVRGTITYKRKKYTGDCTPYGMANMLLHLGAQPGDTFTNHYGEKMIVIASPGDNRAGGLWVTRA